VRFFHGDAGAGLLLLGVAALAMAMANSPWSHGWHALFHGPLAWSPLAILPTLGHWIDDGAMAVLFFAVGLEIKREALVGALSDPRARRLPILAAAAGMAVPALVYLALVGNGAGVETGAETSWHHGWAIPAATDIAFALGVLGLAGRGLPSSLRLFLLGVAVVDDLGAVAIIALAYGHGLQLAWLAAAALVFALMIAANLAGLRRGWTYAAGAGLLWLCVLHSGIHPTVAGVLAAMTVPLRCGAHRPSLLLAMEHLLAPVCTYAIIPLFGLANAGVVFGGGDMARDIAADWRVPLAIVAGLVLGKQAGVLGAIALARWTGFAALPAGARWIHLWGVSLLAGIGFTMSLFIGALAFPAAPELVELAKLGTLAGSLVAGLAGFAVLRFAARVPAAKDPS
jgi:NhaA family Na+:H+ antiporter